jgi:hypothetical protein
MRMLDKKFGEMEMEMDGLGSWTLVECVIGDGTCVRYRAVPVPEYKASLAMGPE